MNMTEHDSSEKGCADEGDFDYSSVAPLVGDLEDFSFGGMCLVSMVHAHYSLVFPKG